MNTVLELKLAPPTLPWPTVMSPTQQTRATDGDVTNTAGQNSWQWCHQHSSPEQLMLVRVPSIFFLTHLNLHSARTARLSPYIKPWKVFLLTFICPKVLLSTYTQSSFHLGICFPRYYSKIHSLLSICLPSHLTGLLQAERQVGQEWLHFSFASWSVSILHLLRELKWLGCREWRRRERRRILGTASEMMGFTVELTGSFLGPLSYVLWTSRPCTLSHCRRRAGVP